MAQEGRAIRRGQPHVKVARPYVRSRARIAIVHRFVHHYRVPFYEGLAGALADRGIALTLVHGQALGEDARGDRVELPWAEHVAYRDISVAGRSMAWQPALPYVRGADLVIVAQEVKLLFNYLAFARHLARRERLAFWGHGVNFQQGSASAPAEALKRVASRRVHWWFAYNALVADIVASFGYPRERISDVRNSIDVEGLNRDKAALSRAELQATLSSAGLHGRNLAVYSGGLYAEKRLDLLIDAADRIRAAQDDFELVIIGGGPQRGIVDEAAARRSWMHATGPLFSGDLVRWLAPAKLLLMPGLVGLVVLDSFALEAPLVTIADSEHSPEIAYLRHGDNGIMLPQGTDAASYAAEVVRLLRDNASRERLVKGCREAQTQYSMKGMVRRFADGVEQALAAPPLRRDPPDRAPRRPPDLLLSVRSRPT